MNQYARIVQGNLDRLFNDPQHVALLDQTLPAERRGNEFLFRAFGRDCSLSPHRIELNGAQARGVRGILVSLYALHACQTQPVLEPFDAYKSFPGNAPYAAAFSARTERVLVPCVERLMARGHQFFTTLDAPPKLFSLPGDLNWVVQPLPKIYLAYICYGADEDFPASVRCLFSNNARRFLPLDALADVGEYTSREILQRLSSE